MGHHRDLLGCKEKGPGEKHSPLSERCVYPEVTPPPSYRSVNGLGPDQTTHPTASADAEVRKRAQEHRRISQPPKSRNGELAVTGRRGRDRRKHHRARSSSSSHNSSWAAKLVFQGLRSSLSGSSSSGHACQDSGQGLTSSRTTKVDFSNTSRDIHYTVHNHWHGSSASEPLPRNKTWPVREPTRPIPHPCAHLMSGALSTFGFDEHNEPSVRRGVAGQPGSQEYHRPFECFLSRAGPHMSEEIDTGLPFHEGYETVFRPHPADAGSYVRASQDIWWSDEPEAQQTFASEQRRRSDAFTSSSTPASKTPFGTNGPGKYTRESASSHERRYSTSLHDSEYGTQAAVCQLAAYNGRWDYIDSVQHPYSHELPWPVIRPGLSFDHMKCDVFFFFARGCGLEPDRAKAPKLDFTLPQRSPYPSYDRRQQEWARKMLKLFKRQIQREKLHWHEDKLRRKFPEAIERDDDRRKAVWAAIAEGSAVCDTRLRNMF